MKLLSTIQDHAKAIYSNVNWSIIILLIAAGVATAIITFIIGMYIFAACAHLKSAYGYARAFLWTK